MIANDTLIKEFESCKLKAYPDPATGGAPWTIGWGATGPDVKKGVVWTQKQADDRLKADVKSRADQITTALGKSSTTQNQFDALVSFAYNEGVGKLIGSTLFRLHKAGLYHRAACEFAKWDWANHKKMAGLLRRRLAEASLYLKGL